MYLCKKMSRVYATSIKLTFIWDVHPQEVREQVPHQHNSLGPVGGSLPEESLPERWLNWCVIKAPERVGCLDLAPSFSEGRKRSVVGLLAMSERKKYSLANHSPFKALLKWPYTNGAVNTILIWQYLIGPHLLKSSVFVRLFFQSLIRNCQKFIVSKMPHSVACLPYCFLRVKAPL